LTADPERLKRRIHGGDLLLQLPRERLQPGTSNTTGMATAAHLLAVIGKIFLASPVCGRHFLGSGRVALLDAFLEAEPRVRNRGGAREERLVEALNRECTGNLIGVAERCDSGSHALPKLENRRGQRPLVRPEEKRHGLKKAFGESLRSALALV